MWSFPSVFVQIKATIKRRNAPLHQANIILRIYIYIYPVDWAEPEANKLFRNIHVKCDYVHLSGSLGVLMRNKTTGTRAKYTYISLTPERFQRLWSQYKCVESIIWNRQTILVCVCVVFYGVCLLFLFVVLCCAHFVCYTTPFWVGYVEFRTW